MVYTKPRQVEGVVIRFLLGAFLLERHVFARQGLRFGGIARGVNGSPNA
jgi:hypothetical protein